MGPRLLLEPKYVSIGIGIGGTGLPRSASSFWVVVSRHRRPSSPLLARGYRRCGKATSRRLSECGSGGSPARRRTPPPRWAAGRERPFRWSTAQQPHWRTPQRRSNRALEKAVEERAAEDVGDSRRIDGSHRQWFQVDVSVRNRDLGTVPAKRDTHDTGSCRDQACPDLRGRQLGRLGQRSRNKWAIMGRTARFQRPPGSPAGRLRRATLPVPNRARVAVPVAPHHRGRSLR